MPVRYTITIDTLGAAFDDAPTMEIARILREMAQRIEFQGIFPVPRDINGNVCGKVILESL